MFDPIDFINYAFMPHFNRANQGWVIVTNWGEEGVKFSQLLIGI